MTARFTSNPPPKTLLADVVGFRCVAFHIFLLNSLGNKDKSIKYFKSPPSHPASRHDGVQMCYFQYLE